jgi:hypothetical protein
MMNLNAIRLGFIIAGSLFFLLSLGIFFSISAATQLWIWPAAPALNLAFVGAWFAGGTAALVWIGLSGHVTAFRALMLTLFVALTGSSIQLFRNQDLAGNERYLPFAILFVITALIALVVFFSTRHTPETDPTPAPVAVRWAFLLFSAILLAVGFPMVFDLTPIFPVELATDTTIVYGWFFLGSFVFYFSGYLKSTIGNTTAQMIGFLVYDVLLIPPFLAHLPDVDPGLQTNLIIYLTVLISSAIFCVYFLFVHRETRLTAQVGREAK